MENFNEECYQYSEEQENEDLTSAEKGFEPLETV